MWILIKNNCKLMFRNKIVVLLAIFGPVLIIAALSSAFHDLLDNNNHKAEFVLGYSIEEENVQAGGENALIKIFKDQGITCKEYNSNMADEAVGHRDVDVFMRINDGKTTLYGTKPDSVEIRICKYAVNQYEQGLKIHENALSDVQYPIDVKLKEQTLKTPKMAEATDYYGMIEIVYFIWICMIFLSPVVQSERKNHIQARFVASPKDNWQLYFGKFLPCVAFCAICTAISIVISVLMFNVHWGNYAISALILFMTTLAATSFGILCLYLVNNLAASVVILFVVTWFGGFVGGSFGTYMLSGCSESVKRLSPLYFANRTLVEYSVQGSSKYTGMCIIYLGCMTLVFTFLGIILMKRRRGDK